MYLSLDTFLTRRDLEKIKSTQPIPATNTCFNKQLKNSASQLFRKKACNFQLRDIKNIGKFIVFK